MPHLLFDIGRRVSVVITSLVLITSSAPRSTTAAERAHPIIASFERFHSEQKPSDLGELLLGELGCVACHAATEKPYERISLKVAPRLDDIASRVRPEYLMRFLDDPQSVKPGTTMPRLTRNLSRPERAAVIDRLVHFLMTRRPSGPRPRPPTGRRERGRMLYHSVGCVACHISANSMRTRCSTFARAASPHRKRGRC